MIVEDQYYVSGRGLVVTGKLIPGEPYPRLDTVPVVMPDGSMLSATITGIERSGQDTERRPKMVGLALRGFDKTFSLRGASVHLDRRFTDRRSGQDRRKS